MSNVKKYFWLKLKDNFFQQKEIKKLRKIAGGDTYTIIYLKLQLLSIRKEGIITFDGTEENLAEQLALEIDEDKDNITIVLSFLKANNLIEELEADNFLLTKVPECIGKESESAERVRRHRQRKALQEKGEIKMLEENKKALQCNVTVTRCNTEIDTEKEINTDIYTTQNFSSNSKQVLSSSDNKNKEFIEAYTHLQLSSNMSKQVIDWRYERLEQAIRIFNNKEGKYFSMLKKIYEDDGNFVKKNTSSSAHEEINPKSFNNFPAREYDFDSLEAKLLGWDKD